MSRPARAQSRGAHSVASNEEMNDVQAEADLQKIQKMYLISESERKQYSHEARETLKRQRYTLDNLKRDYQYLIEQKAALEARLQETHDNGVASSKASKLHEEIETHSHRIKMLHQQIHEYDLQAKELDAKIAQQRSEMGGANAPSQNSAAVAKQIRTLENRLDKALVKFNKALAVNKKLRQQIDNLRRERQIFDAVYHKLERELAEQKKTMADIIEASSSAYEARTEAQTKMVALKEKAEKEQQAYQQEIKELNRTLEQDRKLKSFMSIKGAERTSHSLAEGKLSKNTKAEKGSQDALTDTIENYELAFSKIREVTNISDINELVSKFTQVEDQNFSLFNYVNELNNEIEKLSEETVQINAQIDKLRGEAVTVNNERKELLADLESKLNAINEKTDQYQSMYSKTSHILDDLKKGIHEIFVQIDGASLASPSLLAAGDVNDSNIMQYLGCIEQRANELLRLDSLYSRSVNTESLLGKGPTAPLGQISIQAPSTGDDHDHDHDHEAQDDMSEEDDRPLTREELKAKAKTLRAGKREKSVRQTKSRH